MAFLVNYHIVWLQISKNDILFVQGLDSKKNFLNVEPGFILAETLLNLQILAKVTTWAVIWDQE